MAISRASRAANSPAVDNPEQIVDKDPEALSPTQQWAAEYANSSAQSTRRRGHSPRRDRRNQGLEDALRARLGPIGHELMFREDDLFIDGEVIGKHLRRQFARHRELRDYLTNDDAFGTVIDQYLPTLVKRRAQTDFVVDKRKLHLARALLELGYDVKRGTTIVGRLTATTFTNVHGEEVHGRFWGPGPHWAEAALLLVPADQRPTPTPTPVPPRPRDRTPTVPDASEPPRPQPAEPPSRRATERTELTRTDSQRMPRARTTAPVNWPDGAPTDLRTIAAAASDALRGRRVRADDLAVEIDCGSRGVVKFWPARFQPPRGRLELPFEAQTSDGTMRGRVYLRSPRTPLSIQVERRDDAVELLATWTLVLQVAAARYSGSTPEDDEGAEPLGFVPDAATRRILRHWVVAHMARLPAGHRLGVEAAKAADEAGIELAPGYTWRKGHWSGGRARAINENTPLRYTWRPPA
jgi:hypothetical protein